MNKRPPLILSGTLTQDALAGQVAIVTGAGGGIGIEAARALAWLGAHAIIAEKNRQLGRDAQLRINNELGKQACTFIQTDVGSERSVRRLATRVQRTFSRVDAVINNATVAPVGAVVDMPIGDWDTSYRVNLRGPVLMARAFLPGMLARDAGVFICISSVGEKYMGPYESLKAAQVHLARTLEAESEGRNVVVFTIGPGLVLTGTAQHQIAHLAQLYGMTTDAFYSMSREHIISAEEAGAGFAAAVALAPRFRGLEIDSTMALRAAGIESFNAPGQKTLSDTEKVEALADCRIVLAALSEQAEGWEQRSMFERQWMKRDFQKYAKLPVDQFLVQLRQLETALQIDASGPLPGVELPERLASYFTHYLEMAKGYIKDAAVLDEQATIIKGWIGAAERLDRLLNAQP